MNRQPAFLGGSDERVRSRTRFFRGRENSGDLIPAREEGFEHGLAKGLLTDDDYTHPVPSD
jgi:hypothetical protein